MMPKQSLNMGRLILNDSPKNESKKKTVKADSEDDYDLFADQPGTSRATSPAPLLRIVSDG